jgi:hypothetical protein
VTYFCQPALVEKNTTNQVGANKQNHVAVKLRGKVKGKKGRAKEPPFSPSPFA